jgi:hypothetical protein
VFLSISRYRTDACEESARNAQRCGYQDHYLWRIPVTEGEIDRIRTWGSHDCEEVQERLKEGTSTDGT